VAFDRDGSLFLERDADEEERDDGEEERGRVAEERVPSGRC
jgi:hypothetical protein